MYEVIRFALFLAPGGPKDHFLCDRSYDSPFEDKERGLSQEAGPLCRAFGVVRRLREAW